MVQTFTKDILKPDYNRPVGGEATMRGKETQSMFLLCCTFYFGQLAIERLMLNKKKKFDNGIFVSDGQSMRYCTNRVIFKLDIKFFIHSHAFFYRN